MCDKKNGLREEPEGRYREVVTGTLHVRNADHIGERCRCANIERERVATILRNPFTHWQPGHKEILCWACDTAMT